MNFISRIVLILLGVLLIGVGTSIIFLTIEQVEGASSFAGDYETNMTTVFTTLKTTIPTIFTILGIFLLLFGVIGGGRTNQIDISSRNDLNRLLGGNEYE